MIKGKAFFSDCSVISSFVYDCEKKFEAQLLSAADDIITRDSKIVTICGPTCSGKTTTANKLLAYLSEKGKRVHVVSFDDFYFDREEIIRMCRQRGVTVEYESSLALDLELLSKAMKAIAERKNVIIPKYDFSSGTRSGYKEYSVSDDDMFVFEGIQALYPEVSEMYDKIGRFSIYINVDEGIDYGDVSFDRETVRFLRRLVRDHKHRAASVEFTYEIWKTVRENEEKNIFPNVLGADCFINSALAYEMNVIKNDAYDFFGTVAKNSECFESVEKLKKKFDAIQTIPEDYVPQGSVLREFID